MQRFLLLVLATGVHAWWNMIWNDEFSGPNINTTKWQNEVNCGGGGNNEQQCYVPDAANSYISNGTLVLKAIQGWHTGSQSGCTDSYGCTNTLPYTSARLRTMMDPAGSWAGGRFEINARLPDGAFLWPAIWMLPQTSAYGGWAASGEIDIMEMRGQNLYSYSTTLHYGGAWPNNHYWGQDHGTADLSQGFHQWALEWTVGSKMDFYFDGNWVQNYPLTQWYWDGSWGSPNPYSGPGQPFDKPFYMILNMAVGGNFFNGMGSMAGNQGSLWRKPTLEIDYVRVYKWDTSVPTTQAVTTEAVTTGAVTTEAVTTEAVSTGAIVPPPATTAGPAGTSDTGSQPTTGQTQPIETESDGSTSTTTTGEGASTESVTTTGAVTPDNSTLTGSEANETTSEGLPVHSQPDSNKAATQPNNKKLSSGGQIGIIVAACVCGSVLIAAAAYVVWRRRAQKSEPATVAVDDLVI